MKKRFAFFILTSFLVGVLPAKAQTSDSRFPLFPTAESAQHHCPFDTVVWLDTSSDSYNLGAPPKAASKDTGAYMCQREADQMDYHLVPKAQ